MNTDPRKTLTIIAGPNGAGKTLLKKVKDAQNNGFHVKLIFLSLSSVLLCDFRVFTKRFRYKITSSRGALATW